MTEPISHACPCVRAEASVLPRTEAGASAGFESALDRAIRAARDLTGALEEIRAGSTSRESTPTRAADPYRAYQEVSLSIADTLGGIGAPRDEGWRRARVSQGRLLGFLQDAQTRELERTLSDMKWSVDLQRSVEKKVQERATPVVSVNPPTAERRADPQEPTERRVQPRGSSAVSMTRAAAPPRRPSCRGDGTAS